jgi:predicted DNA-binding transcriptional regulator AlpA
MSKTTEDEIPVPATKGIRGELITVKQVSAMLRISPTWVYNTIRCGKLPFDYFQPTPGRFIFDSADVQDYFLACRVPAGT